MALMVQKGLLAFVALAACGVAFDVSAAAIAVRGKPVARRERPSVPLVTPDESTAVVSFVRRYLRNNDGLDYDIWDGETYVGLLSAGNLLQYKTTPGKHVFLMMGRVSHAWVFMDADLLPGKEYFSRAFPIPFSLQAMDARSDVRIDEWLAMRIEKPLTDGKKARVIINYRGEAQSALAAFKSGEVTNGCALWFPPPGVRKDRGKPAPPSRNSGICVPLTELKAEFGR